MMMIASAACARSAAPSAGSVLLRVLANDVPGRQSCLEKTIPQAHADVVVCLVPRACRQDVGNQQRRLRVVRHGLYHGRRRVGARVAFTKWRFVTARVHVVGTAKSARFSREINGRGRGRPRDHASTPRPRRSHDGAPGSGAATIILTTVKGEWSGSARCWIGLLWPDVCPRGRGAIRYERDGHRAS